ncbi:hypothetical protein HOY82DRAFT_598103 [Tuber indicum]|nr:hypothetical protein HOY82DRAFT_598103 [Tuber indicum]
MSSSQHVDRLVCEILSYKGRIGELERRVEELERKLKEKDTQLHGWVKEVEPFTPKKRITPADMWPRTPVSGAGKRRMMAELAVEDGKRRKVGGPVDPEGLRGNGPVVAVKVGGVPWEGVLGVPDSDSQGVP